VLLVHVLRIYHDVVVSCYMDISRCCCFMFYGYITMLLVHVVRIYHDVVVSCSTDISRCTVNKTLNYTFDSV
jgi:hypothetical protein